MCVLIICLFFLLFILPSESPRLDKDLPERVFRVLGKFCLCKDSLPRMDLHPYLFYLSSYLLSFVLLLLLLSRFSRVRLCATP